MRTNHWQETSAGRHLGQTSKGKKSKRKRSAPIIVERNLCQQCLADQVHASRRRAGNVGMRANHWHATSEDAIFENLMDRRKQRVFNGFQRGFEQQLREQQDLTDAAGRVAAYQTHETRDRLAFWELPGLIIDSSIFF